jgi:hypothetical protein
LASAWRRGVFRARASNPRAGITPCASGDLRALLPEARVREAVTETNWEGTGVVPDIPCDPAEALTAAIEAVSQG